MSRFSRPHPFRFLALAAVAAGLGGCAFANLSDETANALYAAPGKYNHFNCRDLDATRPGLIARESQLRELMEKAGSGPGGAIVNAVAYRNEYLQTRGSLKLLRDAAVEKNCPEKPPA